MIKYLMDYRKKNPWKKTPDKKIPNKLIGIAKIKKI